MYQQMPLTDIQIKHFKPNTKAYKKSDEKGLFIMVNPSGSKYWRLAYRYAGKQNTLPLGVYPDVSLKEAREQRDDARRQLRDGIDPSIKRKMDKQAKVISAANSFEAVGREWHEKFKTRWSENHSQKILTRLEKDLFPWLGKRPISEIEPPELLLTIRRIENRGALETAHRTLQICGQIFRYAISTARAVRDLSADLKGALPPVKKGHFSAITTPEELAPLLKDIRGYQGNFVTRIAMQMLPYIFVRPGELRHAEWSEIDFEERLWTIPATKMKMRADHLVPLADQAIALLQEILPLTGNKEYVFPSLNSSRRPMSDNTVRAAFRRMGYTKEQITPHGFRATARTLLDEKLEFPIHLIEHQLAHAVKDANGRAYNRTAHLPQRREMMQDWANYLDDLAS